MSFKETAKTVSAGMPGTYLMYDKERVLWGEKPWVLKDIETDALIESFNSKEEATYFIEQNS